MDAGGLMPWADVEGVGGFRGDDHGGAEGAPNLADLGLQGVGRVDDPPSPHSSVDQAVGADRPPPLER